MSAKRIKEFEIISHGTEHEQYFQGCGTFGTPFDEVTTGIGSTEKEAYEDALEMLAQSDWDVKRMPKRPRGIHSRPVCRQEDCWFYVSIRVR